MTRASFWNPSVNRRSFFKVVGITSLAGMAGAFPGSLTLCTSAGDEPAKPADGKLIVHSTVPMNAEPPLSELVASWLTPIDRFYIRSHAPVPEIDVKRFRLTVEGGVRRPLELSLEELKSGFERVSVVATMTCAGNRRSEHSRIKPVDGVQWREGAIGNARWGGVRLSDVLKKAGLKETARHVWLDGLDQVERNESTIPFGASIPIEKALADTESMPGALLATQMNDEPLARHHGFPLRAVVPGYIGARSVKWLGRIIVSDRPSPNHYVSGAYKLVEQGSPLEWAEAGPIYRFPINSVICRPDAGATLKAGRVTIAGYALPPGEPEVKIDRVEVSVDGGRSWTRARFTLASRPYCWQLWQAEIAVTAATRELRVRAVDSRGRTQPQRVDWNLKGYLFNAPHRVPVKVG